jgi:hypothetical protein
MDIVIESVKKLETLIEHSGCSDGGVQLDVDASMVSCQYEKGASMTAVFGGKRGVFSTFDPIRACTRISFMFGAPLDSPQVRGAACAIISVAAGFFCLARILQPCERSRQAACRDNLLAELKGKSVYNHGAVYGIDSLSGINLTDDPVSSEILLIGAEGCIASGAGDLIEQYSGRKRILCIGPSTAGISRINELEHWCPYGRS